MKLCQLQVNNILLNYQNKTNNDKQTEKNGNETVMPMKDEYPFWQKNHTTKTSMRGCRNIFNRPNEPQEGVAIQTQCPLEFVS